MRSADFWSNGRDHGFKIDTSFLSPVEAAIYWYDRIISEFPNTPSSRVAYEEKMRTILGWREPGQYGDKYGVKLNRSYITQLESTFRLYESSFPEASEIQGFRYLISQAYWNQKDWIKTREWLNEIIQKDGNANSFYKDLARHRLLKIEY